MPQQEAPDEDAFFTFPLDPDDDEAVLSFDKLRAAFANLNTGETDSDFVVGDQDRQESDSLAENDAGDADEDGEPYESIETSEKEHCEISPRTIFEAMLFVGNRENKPLTPEHAVELMRNVSPEELVAIVRELNDKYARMNAPYHIIGEDNGFRMVLRPEFEPVRAGFYNKVRETKLSQAAIDVLAVVAYRQPVSAEEVQQIRKSPSQSILQQLVKRGLIDTQKILNKKKATTLFRTTDRFLKLFQLESLDDLPTAEEIDFR